MQKILNPKRITDSKEGKGHWFNYYAGYSSIFAESVIARSKLVPAGIVLDPWNGSGTTIEAAVNCGFNSIGIDLNPAMKVISASRLARRDDVNLARVKLKSVRKNKLVGVSKEDALLLWFDKNSVRVIRTYEYELIGREGFESIESYVEAFSKRDSLLYVILFKAIRELLSEFIPTNPTWIKKPKLDSEKVSVNWSKLKVLYLSIFSNVLNDLSFKENNEIESFDLLVGSSTNIPLKSNSIDLVITSPPYCTRIDYGVAMMPELALLSRSGVSEVDRIRRSLMGTTTVPKNIDECSEFGENCSVFLLKVKQHGSVASSGYYYKNYYQYFYELFLSLKEVGRVLKKKGEFYCVIQDSYYKEVHCDLPLILSDMASNSGLTLVERKDFLGGASMVYLNTRSKKYRATTAVTESVLVFKKGEE
jgi:DNA modification methylase